MIEKQQLEELCARYDSFFSALGALDEDDRSHFINHAEALMVDHGYNKFSEYLKDDDVLELESTPDEDLKARWNRMYESTGEEFREVVKDAQHLSLEEQERLLEYFWYSTVEHIGELGLATASESEDYAKYLEDVKRIESKDDSNERSII